jgi:DNA replication protein DnaC
LIPSSAVKVRPVARVSICSWIFDELGYVPASKTGAELLFDVIATAYERTWQMVTTNLPFEHWTEVLGNEHVTGAA